MYADTLPTRWRPICNLNNETNYATEKPGVHVRTSGLPGCHALGLRVNSCKLMFICAFA